MDKQIKDTVALLLDATPIVFKQKCFAMKGGTAINFFCRDMPRLSVDIDLVFIDPDAPKRDEALASIEDSLQQIAEKLEKRLDVKVRKPTSASDHETVCRARCHSAKDRSKSYFPWLSLSGHRG